MFSYRGNGPIISGNFQVEGGINPNDKRLAPILSHARDSILRTASPLMSLAHSPDPEGATNIAFVLAGPKDLPTIAIRCKFLDGAPAVYAPQRSFLCVQISYTRDDHLAKYGTAALDEAVKWAARLSKDTPIFLGCITWAHDEASRQLANKYPGTSSLKEQEQLKGLFKLNETEASLKAATHWYFTSAGEALKALKIERSLGVKIRAATEKDIGEMVDLSKAKRHEYARYQPIFWRPAEDAEQKQAVFFKDLLQDRNNILLVSETPAGEIDGFVIGMPKGDPLLDPAIQMTKGLHIDDFAVAHDQLWSTVGRELLINAVEEHHARKGADAVVNVITGAHDRAKRHLLEELGKMRLLYTWDILPSGNLYSEPSP